MSDRRKFIAGGATLLVGSVLTPAALFAASSEETLTVAVMGATGRTGRFVIDQLLALGHHVIGVSRSAGRQEAREGVSWISADVTASETLRKPLKKADAVIYAVGVNFEDVPESVLYDVYLTGVENTATEAKKSGVKRMVLLASAGKAEGHYRASYDAKFKGEDALRSSGINYSISRTWGLSDEPGGKYGILLTQSEPLPGGGPFMICREDSASVLVECAVKGNADNRTFTVANVISYDKNSWRKALSLLEQD